jgi:hypothetical protein
LSKAYDESSQNQEEDLRRNHPTDLDTREVTFARRFLHPEQIEAVREFLCHASSDEVATIRKLFGETPEVLREIGLE